MRRRFRVLLALAAVGACRAPPEEGKDAEPEHSAETDPPEETDVDTSGPLPYWTALSAGSGHLCGLSSSGGLACWGLETEGEAQLVKGGPFQQVSSTVHYNCALRVDGTVACWGVRTGRLADEEYDYGQGDPPEGRFSFIVTGYYGAYGIVADTRELVYWGTEHGEFPMPPGRTWQTVAYESRASCGITTEGELLCWGGQHACAYWAPHPYGWSQVVAGGDFFCVGGPDRNVDCWCSDWGGTGFPPEDGHYTKLSAGENATCGLRPDGRIECWSTLGLVGWPVAKEFPTEGRWLDVAFGSGWACGIRDDRQIECWGAYEHWGIDRIPDPP